MKIRILFLILLLYQGVIYSQHNYMFPTNFGEKASVHVKTLCNFGERIAGSHAELETVKYLIDKFQQNGLIVTIDTFKYRYYKLGSRCLLLNNRKLLIKSAYIDHKLEDSLNFTSKCIKYSNDINKKAFQDKVIFTKISSHSVDLIKFEPKAIIVIEPNVFDSIGIQDNTYSINFNGTFVTDWIQSYNIIARYDHGFSCDSTIIITAHWDSEPGIGAGDNATGTAALIELSDFLRDKFLNLKYNIIFLSTGSHEHNVIGMTSYMVNHYDSIRSCKLNLNIDDISCVKPYIEVSMIRSPQFNSDTSQNLSVISLRDSPSLLLLTSFREIYGNHQINSPNIEWLREKYEESMSELKIDYQDAGCCSGSDANVFDYIGVPYITISSFNPDGEDFANTIKDVYNDSFIPRIQSSGEIISKILLDLNK